MRAHLWHGVALTALVSVLVLGCAGEGDVELRNATNWPATGFLGGHVADLESGEVMGLTVKFGPWLLWGSDEKRVSYEFEGWTAFHYSGDVWVEADATRRIACRANAGCLGMENGTFSGVINGVYIAPPNSPYWGGDELAGHLYPGEFAVWTVDPGYWDVRVEFTDGSWSELYDNHVGFDEFFDITIVGLLSMSEQPRNEHADDFQRSDQPSAERESAVAIRQEGQAPSRRIDLSKTVGETRCELRRAGGAVSGKTQVRGRLR
jgi:hypothetical protein